MSASELLVELREYGVQLVATGGELRYRPREAVTPQLLDDLREHKPELLQLLESEQYKLQGVNCYSEDSRPEVRNLIAVGWKPKERCGKTIWGSPENGFWYSQEMALELLRLDPLAQSPHYQRIPEVESFEFLRRDIQTRIPAGRNSCPRRREQQTR